MDIFLMNLEKIKNNITPNTIPLLEMYCSKLYNKKILCEQLITVNYLPKDISDFIFKIMVNSIHDEHSVNYQRYFYNLRNLRENYIAFGKMLFNNKKMIYNRKVEHIFWYNSTNIESTNY